MAKNRNTSLSVEDQKTVGGTNGSVEGDESNEPIESTESTNDATTREATPLNSSGTVIPPPVRKPGRQPGSIAALPFPWDVTREEVLIQAIYNHSEGNACSLTSDTLYAVLKDHEAFKSSPVTLTLNHVKDRYKQLVERMKAISEPFPVLARNPHTRARTTKLDAEGIKAIRDAILGTRQPLSAGEVGGDAAYFPE